MRKELEMSLNTVWLRRGPLLAAACLLLAATAGGAGAASAEPLALAWRAHVGTDGSSFSVDPRSGAVEATFAAGGPIGGAPAIGDPNRAFTVGARR
jgi:hypothetical protein